jgi:hypothetical protein
MADAIIIIIMPLATTLRITRHINSMTLLPLRYIMPHYADFATLHCCGASLRHYCFTPHATTLLAPAPLRDITHYTHIIFIITPLPLLSLLLRHLAMRFHHYH